MHLLTISLLARKGCIRQRGRERAVGDLLDSVEFLHGAASCAASSVTCKPPICARAACHHSAQPKARVAQVQSGTSQNRSRQCHAIELSGQAPSLAPAIADTCAREPVGAHVAKFDRKAVAKVVVRDARKPQRRRLFGPPPARLGLFAPSHTPQKARWSVLLVTRHRPSPGRFESHQRAVVQIGSVASPRMRR